jgi:phospholipid-transporting ATPase
MLGFHFLLIFHFPLSFAGATTNRRWKLKSTIAVDSELLELLHKDLVGDERIVAHEFFLALAACNTVVPIRTHDGFSSCRDCQFFEDVETIDYQGESPDEQALVAAASAYGYTLFERTSGHIVIDVNGEKLRYKISPESTLPFSHYHALIAFLMNKTQTISPVI